MKNIIFSYLIFFSFLVVKFCKIFGRVFVMHPGGRVVCSPDLGSRGPVPGFIPLGLEFG